MRFIQLLFCANLFCFLNYFLLQMDDKITKKERKKKKHTQFASTQTCFSNILFFLLLFLIFQQVDSLTWINFLLYLWNKICFLWTYVFPLWTLLSQWWCVAYVLSNILVSIFSAADECAAQTNDTNSNTYKLSEHESSIGSHTLMLLTFTQTQAGKQWTRKIWNI